MWIDPYELEQVEDIDLRAEFHDDDPDELFGFGHSDLSLCPMCQAILPMCLMRVPAVEYVDIYLCPACAGECEELYEPFDLRSCP